MQKTSSVQTRRNPSRRRRARKNPFGLLDEGFLKDALMPAAIGFASGHIQAPENRKQFEFWAKLDLKWKILGLVLAATWLRRKGKHQAEGAALAIAGQHVRIWWKQREAKKDSGAGAGAEDKQLTADTAMKEQPAGALIDYEMEDAMGALFDDGGQESAIDAMNGLARVYDEDFAVAS